MIRRATPSNKIPDPSPKELERRRNRIRDSWSPKTERQRRIMCEGRLRELVYTVPVVSVVALFPDGIELAEEIDL